MRCYFLSNIEAEAQLPFAGRRSSMPRRQSEGALARFAHLPTSRPIAKKALLVRLLVRAGSKTLLFATYQGPEAALFFCLVSRAWRLKSFAEQDESSPTRAHAASEPCRCKDPHTHLSKPQLTCLSTCRIQ